MSLADRINARMNSLGYNQRRLAEDCGVTEVAMCRYLKGNRFPRAETIVKMAKALGFTTDYILGVDRNLDDYREAKFLVMINADKWSAEQKLNIINLLSKGEKTHE